MTRRKVKAIQRAILETLAEKGPMTSWALAKEIRATHRTVKRHSYLLGEFRRKVKRRKVETIIYYPDIKLYRLRKEKQFVRCQQCGAEVVIPE